MTAKARLVGRVHHERISRLVLGNWVSACSCGRFGPEVGAASSVANLWHQHIADEAAAAGVEPVEAQSRIRGARKRDVPRSFFVASDAANERTRQLEEAAMAAYRALVPVAPDPPGLCCGICREWFDDQAAIDAHWAVSGEWEALRGKF